MIGAACVLTKEAVPGRVKTRLAAAVGDEAAAALARAFFADTCAALDALGLELIVAADGVLAAPPPGARVVAQGEGDLGARIERALAHGLGSHPFAIALGSDSPGMPHRILREVIDGLAHADAVIAPAADGGFCALGVRRLVPGMLAGIDWSTDRVLRQTEERLREAGLVVARASEWFDVDVAADLDRLEELLRAGTVTAPATQAALRAMGRR